jgi:hypothetical protein
MNEILAIVTTSGDPLGPPSIRRGQVDQLLKRVRLWKEICWNEIKSLVNPELLAFVDELIEREACVELRQSTWEMQKCLMQIVCFFFA